MNMRSLLRLKAPTEFYLVLSGSVKAYYERDTGVHETILYLEPDGIFGEIDVLLEFVSRYNFEAVTETRLLAINKESLYQLIESDSQASLFLLRLAGYKMRFFQKHYDNSCHKSAMYITCSVLLDLASKYGKKHDGRIEIDHAVSQHFISELTGLSRIRIDTGV